MTEINNSTVITIGGLVVLSNLALTWIQIRLLTSPKPPNATLDNSITHINGQLSEHDRRIGSIETARAECYKAHLAEVAKLYAKVNAIAETLAQTVGRLEGLFPRRNNHG
jgi:hypothetical protein